MSDAERRRFRREVQPIFQDPFDVFNPFYRVDHVLTVPIRRFGLAKSGDEARRLIDEALHRVGLRPQDTLGRFPHELCGGQRQRIMVARAVLLRPKVIMADEPVSMVDASLRATILDELRTLNRDLGISIVYITHDLTTAYQICDDIIILYQGAIAEAGSVERVIRDPKHPYTQLLVASIPLPDRTRSWGGEELKIPEASAGRLSAGCRFAPRCPHVMDDCWTTIPPQLRPRAGPPRRVLPLPRPRGRAIGRRRHRLQVERGEGGSPSVRRAESSDLRAYIRLRASRFLVNVAEVGANTASPYSALTRTPLRVTPYPHQGGGVAFPVSFPLSSTSSRCRRASAHARSPAHR